MPRVRNPRPSSEVPDVSGTVPVPAAGAATVGVEEAEVEVEVEGDVVDEVEALDVDEPLDAVLSALCTAAVSAVLTRLKAVWLAILARPVASVVDAPNI